MKCINGKTLAVLAIAACALVSLAGCSSATYESGDGGTVERFDSGGWRYNTLNTITDRSTGVEYLIVEGFGDEIAVCPLYNPDGTLCTE